MAGSLVQAYEHSSPSIASQCPIVSSDHTQSELSIPEDADPSTVFESLNLKSVRNYQSAKGMLSSELSDVAILIDTNSTLLIDESTLTDLRDGDELRIGYYTSYFYGNRRLPQKGDT